MVSLSQLQEVPPKNLILLVGPPGSGKSFFCEQAILRNLAIDKPIIYVTTEYDSSRAEAALREKGLGKVEPDLLSFIDAYNETVGVSVSARPDTIYADCNSLSSIDVAILKLQDRIRRNGVLLVFDSLTSPYLFNGSEILRFIRLTLSRFVARGNAVLACIDEGCGKSEDLVSIMSLSDGVIKSELKEGSKVLDVVKHPKLDPTRIEVPIDKSWERQIYGLWDRDLMRRFLRVEQNLGEFSVNIFWPAFAFWSSMLWDPKGFPKMNYDVWKEYGTLVREAIPLLPFRTRLFFKSLMPKDFNKVEDMRKLLKSFIQAVGENRRDGFLEYLDDISKTDEHYIRIYENRECWGFENIGTTMAFHFPGIFAGNLKGFEKVERDWNVIETKCIGLGDQYCEFKVVPREIDELKNFLQKDLPVIQNINDRMMKRLMEFLLEGKPLVDRPRLGSDFLMANPEMALPALVGERYRMAVRMGGARRGKEVGEYLIETGIRQDKATTMLLQFLEYCKVGKVKLNETIRIRDNCESLYTKYYETRWEEPACYFTTGFLNGFFSAVKNQHVKEVKCIAMGNPYCEWEFR